jgi:hypothetical protein
MILTDCVSFFVVQVMTAYANDCQTSFSILGTPKIFVPFRRASAQQ